MTLLEQPDYRAIRRRLLNPPNGKGASTELEILSPAAERSVRREQALALEEARRAECDFRRREAIDNQIRTALQDRAEAQRIAERLIAEDQSIPKPPTVLQILYAVSREYGVTVIDLMSQRRTADVVRPRQVAMYLARKMTLRSLPQISMTIGGRDHTTALHGVNKIAGLLPIDPDLAERVNKIREKLSTDLVAARVSDEIRRAEE